jgi:hypothetical protein
VDEQLRLPRLEVLPQHAFDAYVYASTIIPGAGDGPEALDPYAPPVRQLYAAYLLDGEIKNGGFSQLFFNGLGVWLDEAIAGLAAAGLHAHSKVLDEAGSFGATQLEALTTARRRGTLEDYVDWDATSNFRPFDDRWYDLPSIDTAMDRFLTDHAEEIWEPAT